jgi:hypothetical protein
MSWRDDPITDRQKWMIETMIEDAGMNGAIPLPPFYGKTKGEASDWISENMGKQYESFNCHENAGDRI